MINKEQNKAPVGVIGAGTMGMGIVQVAVMAGHPVLVFDVHPASLEKGLNSLKSQFSRLMEKGKISAEEADWFQSRIQPAKNLGDFKDCILVIEAIIEQLDIKKKLFAELEMEVSKECLLASNTSSLSITSIASACKKQDRVLGLHFFNPAPLMPLVEVIPGIASSADKVRAGRELIDNWGKTTVLAKDTPGFIVNRLARSFYGESIRIYEEGCYGVPEGTAGFASIDAALKSAGAFRMGPFELMDLIGNDINFTVTETVWQQFFMDPRYTPSLTQKRLVEAGRYGKKSGQGYYDYTDHKNNEPAVQDPELAQKIFSRVIAMLINEAVETLYLRIATKEDLDLAMTKGVNYPKGLLKWCDELGAENILHTLETLQSCYGEARYRPSILLKDIVKNKIKFYS